MNQVLAGIALFAGAFGILPIKKRPLSRDPDDEELGMQFVERVDDLRNEAGDFLYWNDNEFSPELDHRGLLDDGESEALDSAFVDSDGCVSRVRRAAREAEDSINEVRAVARHPRFNIRDSRRAYLEKCEDDEGISTVDARQICNEQWDEAEWDWDNIVSQIDQYKKLEQRNCPALISGVDRRRIR